jgi:hypothetical protein
MKRRMRTRCIWLGGFLLLSVGCPNRSKSAAAPSPVDAGGATVAAAALTQDAGDAPTRWEKDPPLGYEAEVEGEVEDLDHLKPAKIVAFMTPDGCEWHRLDKLYLSALAHPDVRAAKKAFRIEPVVRDHEKLFLCAIAIDRDGRTVIGAGAYPKNPIEFVKPPGHDELEIEDLDVPLRKLKPPVVFHLDRF